MRTFNYLYVQETTLQPWGIHTNTWTYRRGDAPICPKELKSLATEMAYQLMHDKNTAMAKITLMHSERGLLASATVERE